MEIRQLRRFLVLAEELHFGRAATRLHIAQPALSQELKSLERSLGLVLMERSHTHVALTDAGQLLRREAVEIMRAHDAAVLAMECLRKSHLARLRLGVAVGVPELMLTGLLTGLLAGLRTDAADLDITIETVAAEDGLQRLRGGELDAVFIHAVPGAAADLVVTVLAEAEMGVAVPSSSRLAGLAAVRPADLSGEPLIWLQRDGDAALRQRITDAMTAGGMTPGPDRKSPSISTSLSLVAAGLGISFKLPHEVRPDLHPGVVWRPLAGAVIAVPTVFVSRSGDSSLMVRRLAEIVRKSQSV